MDLILFAWTSKEKKNNGLFPSNWWPTLDLEVIIFANFLSNACSF